MLSPRLTRSILSAEALLGEPTDDDVQRIDDLIRQASALVQSNGQAALALADEALARAEPLGHGRGVADAHLNAGRALMTTGAYDRAVVRFYQAQSVYAELSDDNGVIRALNGLGAVFLQVGDTEQAMEYLGRSLELARERKSAARELAALNNIGELLSREARYEEALEHYGPAAERAAELGDRGLTAIILNNLGRVCVDLGRLEEASGHLRRSLELAAAEGDRVTEAEVLTTMGRTTPDQDEARALHVRSVELCREAAHPSGECTALENLAALCIRVGRLGEAEECLDRAMSIAELISVPSSFERHHELVRAYEASGDLASAFRAQSRLVNGQERSRSRSVARRVQALRAHHEIVRMQAEAELFRIGSVELKQKGDELERSNQKLRLLHTIGSQLTAALEFETMARRLYERVNTIMDAPVFGVGFFNETAGSIEFDHMIEVDQRIAPFSVPVVSESSFATWVARNRKEIWLNDAVKQHEEYVRDWRPFTRRVSHSVVFLPLELDGRLVGVLTVQSFRRNAYTEDQIDTLRLLSPYIAVVVDNARKVDTIRRLNRELEEEKRELESANGRIVHLANHDHLTGLPNRRLLKELVGDHIALARRQSRMFGLLYLDLDDFKPVNDTFGHAAGDLVLARVAERLRSAVRESDTVARLGGDEFVLLVRDVGDRDSLATIAEKMRSALSAPFTVDQTVCRITASIGVSLYPSHGQTYDELMNAADRAMFDAKRAGKAGVVFATRGGYRSRTLSSDQSMESSSKPNLPST